MDKIDVDGTEFTEKEFLLNVIAMLLGNITRIEDLAKSVGNSDVKFTQIQWACEGVKDKYEGLKEFYPDLYIPNRNIKS